MFTGVLLSVVMLLAATALAADKTTVEINKAVTVSGHSLAAGKYTVTWDGSGPNVDLKVFQGKNLVATVPGQIVSLNTITLNDSVVIENEPAGRVLTQIRPKGKKLSLVVGNEAVQTAADTNAK